MNFYFEFFDYLLLTNNMVELILYEEIKSHDLVSISIYDADILSLFQIICYVIIEIQKSTQNYLILELILGYVTKNVTHCYIKI